MKKSSQVILVIVIFIISVLLVFLYFNNSSTEEQEIVIPISEIIDSENELINDVALLSQPLEKALDRITKKPFGVFITPENSPVSPEKFSGYHTGVDFEIFSEEENIEVKILAVCTGPLVYKKYVSGYGGVVIQSCDIAQQNVTVLYGHLSLNSVVLEVNDQMTTGEQFAVLGDGNSQETDFERQHLHLGIHKGEDINLFGYVKNEKELENWLDPSTYLINT